MKSTTKSYKVPKSDHYRVFKKDPRYVIYKDGSIGRLVLGSDGELEEKQLKGKSQKGYRVFEWVVPGTYDSKTQRCQKEIYMVGRMVYEHFERKLKPGEIIHYRDGNGANCALSNLVVYSSYGDIHQKKTIPQKATKATKKK